MLLLFAGGASIKEAATALRLSVPTFRKHYFAELEVREAAALMMEGRQLERLNAAAEDGNVTAEKELFKQLQRLRDRHAATAYAKPAKPPKLGKKEQRKIDAATPPADKGWRDLVTPPPGLPN